MYCWQDLNINSTILPMHHSLAKWKFILQSFESGLPVALLYVLDSSGSSPGRPGFFMAVNSHHEMRGSIGGGIMEHKLVEMAMGILNEKVPGRQATILKQVHDPAAPKNRSGMICSGEQTVMICRLQATDVTIIQQLVKSLEENVGGTLELLPAGLKFSTQLPAKDHQFIIQPDGNWQYLERTGFRNQLYIIGGGHCALALSRIMSGMDFHIRLFEERDELNTVTENDYVHSKHIVPDYSSLGSMIPSGESNYVVIMTFGYRTDDRAFRAIMDKKFRYLGILGSKEKIAKMFESYREEGIVEEILQNIHAPIGLPINSHSPEEIAISIAAEIVQVKNK